MSFESPKKQVISPKTDLYAVIGHPLSHTLSPVIHNGLFQDYGIDAVYHAFAIKDTSLLTKDILETFRIRGLSVTIPYKEWAYQFASDHDKTSQAMLASNTLLIQETVRAFNTDGTGAVRSLEEFAKSKLEHSKLVMLGSGGSAKGIAFSLLPYISPKRPLHVIARNVMARKELKAKLELEKPDSVQDWGFEDPKQIAELLSGPTLLINTTPLGMKGYSDQSPIPKTFLHKDIFVFDIVYNPIQTQLVKDVMATKGEFLPGYFMLIHQAMAQFELFTGVRPSSDDVKRTEKRILERL